MSNEIDYAGGMKFSDLATQAQQIVDRIDTPDTTVVTQASEPGFQPPPATTTTDVTSQDPAQTAQSTQEPSQGQVLELTDDALVRVKIDGQIEEVPYKEFKDSLQREAAWHKRQQAFAQGKKEFEQFYVQRYAELEQAARALQTYEQQLQGQLQHLGTQPQTAQTQAAQQKVVDEIATLNEVRQEAERVGQSIEQKLAARDQLINQQIQNAVQQLKQETAAQREASKFTSMLRENVLDHPEFKQLNEVIPNFEQNLRYQVWQLGPQNLDEAADFAAKIAKDWASKLKTISVTEQQRADAQRARAKLESSEGSAPPPKNATKPRSFIGKDGKLNHTALREAAMQLLG